MQLRTRFEGYSQRSVSMVILMRPRRNKRTIRSIPHVALSESGCMDTQLSRAIPKLEPPQIRTLIGSV
jgi:hypothetical protein